MRIGLSSSLMAVFVVQFKYVCTGFGSVGEYTLSVFTNNDTSMPIPTVQFV